jgi:hypothetical protein
MARAPYMCPMQIMTMPIKITRHLLKNPLSFTSYYAFYYYRSFKEKTFFALVSRRVMPLILLARFGGESFSSVNWSSVSVRYFLRGNLCGCCYLGEVTDSLIIIE